MPADFVYRALTKEAKPTDKSFRLRPGELFLSVAATKQKSMWHLKCKGWAKLDVAKIGALGLSVRVKTVGQTDPPDEDLFEIVGVPSYGSNERLVQDCAIGLAQTVCESDSVSKMQPS